MDTLQALGLGSAGTAPWLTAAAVTVVGWTLVSANAGRRATRWYRRKRILGLLLVVTGGFAALTLLGLRG